MHYFDYIIWIDTTHATIMAKEEEKGEVQS
jgi:hypothetical protein